MNVQNKQNKQNDHHQVWSPQRPGHEDSAEGCAGEKKTQALTAESEEGPSQGRDDVQGSVTV